MSFSFTRSSIVPVCAVLAFAGLTACSDSDAPTTPDTTPKAVAIKFAAKVGTANFVCGQSYSALGTTSSVGTPTELMMFVSDVRLLKADGTEVPVTLTQDNKWQLDNVALLDFAAGGTGTACANATAEVNTQVVGTVPAGTYAGLRYTVGLPFAKNHSDQSTAVGPLSSSRMFWSWNSGYMALRLDMNTTGKPGGWFMHVGSTGCNPATTGATVPTTCSEPNTGTFTLSGFTAASSVVTLDLAALVATTNLDTDLGGMPGCMSGTTDPECATLFRAMGLGFNGGAVPTTQNFFRVVAQ